MNDENPIAAEDRPSVFISYRRRDTRAVSTLAEQLREDLGRDNVFRDADDIVGGSDWQAELARRIEWATSMLVLIGEQWERQRQTRPTEASRPDGEDGDVDWVVWEVQRALESDRPNKAIPVVVDREMPQNLPSEVAALAKRQAISVRSESLTSPEDSDYPRVLAAVWNSLTTSVPNGILVVADRGAHLVLEQFVRSLQTEDLLDARFLSQYGANTCVISARAARRKAKSWPDAIILAEGEGLSAYLDNVIAALDEHPGFRRIAVVGSAAAIAGFSAGVTSTTMGNFVGSLSGAGGHATGGVAGMSATAKIGVGFGAAALAVGGVATASIVMSDDEPELGTGDVQFTLRWEGDADLDLHVLGPDGDEISFEDPSSPSGGQLDVDACAGGCRDGESRVENVFWPDGEAPDGTYTAWVDHFGGVPAEFELVARVDGDELASDSGSLSAGARSDPVVIER